MSFTTNWSWTGVSRNKDVNVSSGGEIQTRNSWSFTRKRFSDVANTPQLGDYASSVGAYAGGTLVPEAPDDSDLAHMTFDTTTNWTDSTYKYIADLKNTYVGSGGVAQPIYEIDSAETNKPNAAKTTIVKPIVAWDGTQSPSGAWTWTWQAGEWDVDSNDWLPTDGTPAETYGYYEYTDGTTTGGVTFNAFAVSPTAGNNDWMFRWVDSSGASIELVKNGATEGYIYLPVTGGTSGYLIIGGGDLAVDFKLADNLPLGAAPNPAIQLRAGIASIPVHTTPTN